MSCPDELTLWALVQGTVDAQTMTSLDAHLDECPDCRELVGAVASGVRHQGHAEQRSTDSPSADSPSGKSASGKSASGKSASTGRASKLGRFEVGEALGEGAMGVVFAGVDPELERAVALKVLHAATDSAKGRARLVQEAQAMARLAHPHVLTVYEVGTDGDTVFIAMERGERNLRAAIHEAQKETTPETTRRMFLAAMRDAGRGLAAAHRAGIMHRDFKPENVMLMADGRAKVADFGLAGVGATAGAEGRIDLTRTGALLGTPVYMAPERLRGEAGDARADQFSFCVAMWEVACGKRPFGGGTLDELLSAIAEGPPTSARAFTSSSAAPSSAAASSAAASSARSSAAASSARSSAAAPSARSSAAPPSARSSAAASSAGAALSDGLFKVLRRGLRVDPKARFESMDALLDALDALPADPTPAKPNPRRRLLLAAPVVVALVALTYAALPAPEAPAGSLAEPLTANSPCEGLSLPARPALEGWRGARLDSWRSEWEESRTQICAGSPTRSAAECLSAQAAEVERFAVAGAPSEAFVHLPDPAACEAGSPPLRPELAEARARYRVGDADGVRRSLEDVDSSTTEAMLLGARAERLSAHFEAAAELARSALFKAQLEHDLWNTAEAWLELVVVAGAAGEYEQAARDLAHAEQAVEAANGDSLREQLLHRQGVVRTQLGDFAGARSALSAAVERRSERLGAQSVELAPMFTSLGHLARLEDRLDDAFDHHSAARRLNGMLDPEHLWVARDLHNLGGVLRRQHRTEEALDHYHQSIAIRRRQLGTTHPEVALGLNSVGLVLFEKEDFEGARDTWEQARASFVEHHHADAAMAEHNLALANLALNEPQLALAHALSALHRDEDRLGPDAKRVGVELVTLATALVRLGRVGEAETRVARAKEIAALVGDSALRDEAEAVLAAGRPRRERVVRANQGDPASVETEDATPVLDTESDEPADAVSTMEREQPPRPGGSGSYGGGQAWE